jgi:anti-sigma B factor antagonist
MGGRFMAANPAPPLELSFETIRNPEEIIIRCVGKITSYSSAELQTAVRGLMPETKCIVLDLTGVSYMDSSGLGAIIAIYLSARRQRCGLKLINLNSRLQDLFRLTKMSSVFEGHGDYLGWTPD